MRAGSSPRMTTLREFSLNHRPTTANVPGATPDTPLERWGRVVVARATYTLAWRQPADAEKLHKIREALDRARREIDEIAGSGGQSGSTGATGTAG